MDKSIMPECYADTLLIETLVPTERGYNHKHNCFKIESEMKSGKLRDKFAVGIIDKDKKQIGYLNQFFVIDEVKDTLILWKHNNKEKNHYFIQICPALEKWILNICTEGNIDLNKLGLKNDLDIIKKETKSASSINNVILKSLFEEINKKANNTNVKKLKNWIRILKEKNYHTDINELKNG